MLFAFLIGALVLGVLPTILDFLVARHVDRETRDDH